MVFMSSSSMVLVLSCIVVAKLLLDAIEFGSDVGFRDAENLRDGGVQIPVEVENDQGAVEFTEAVDHAPERGELFLHRMRLGCCRQLDQALVTAHDDAPASRFTPVEGNGDIERHA